MIYFRCGVKHGGEQDLAWCTRKRRRSKTDKRQRVKETGRTQWKLEQQANKHVFLHIFQPVFMSTLINMCFMWFIISCPRKGKSKSFVLKNKWKRTCRPGYQDKGMNTKERKRTQRGAKLYEACSRMARGHLRAAPGANGAPEWVLRALGGVWN